MKDYEKEIADILEAIQRLVDKIGVLAAYHLIRNIDFLTVFGKAGSDEKEV